MAHRLVQKSITDFFGKKKDSTNSEEENTKNERSQVTPNGITSSVDKSTVSSNESAKRKFSSVEKSKHDHKDGIEKSKKPTKKRKVVIIDSDSGSDIEVNNKNETENQNSKVDSKSENDSAEKIVDVSSNLKSKQETEVCTHNTENNSESKDESLNEEKKQNCNLKDADLEPDVKKSTKNENYNSLDYDPTVEKYHPIKNATWKRGDKVPFLAFSKTLLEIENVQSRLKIIEILSNYFRSVIVLSSKDLLASVYLCLNRIAPAFEGVEMGIAETSLFKAIAQSTGRSMAQIKIDVKEVGDIGLIAEQSRSNQKLMFEPPPLTVSYVFQKFKEISHLSGKMSNNKKVDAIQSLFVACRHMEARYLIRSLAGKLRIGLAEQSVLQALALACTQTPPNASDTFPPKVLTAFTNTSSESFKSALDKNSRIVKSSFYECPNYDLLIPALLQYGIDELPKHCKLTPGCPLKPMLAHPAKGINEVLERFDGIEFTCEWKYDGERAQIHVAKSGKIQIFSRNQEETTSKYPDIVSKINKCFTSKVNECILDCEVVAWEKQENRILPFQVLSTRKRKDASENTITVQICIFIFDLIYLNGKSLIHEPLSDRRQLFKENFVEVENEILFTKYLNATTFDEVQEFLDESVKGNCEGLMVKTFKVDATYEIAKRSRKWLKLKKDYLNSVGDTLDLVVIGGYLGRGKRTGTYGGFLLACYDLESEQYQTVCKLGTGFSDEDLKTHTDFLKDQVISKPKPYYNYDSAHEPDHWFEPVKIWEIKCADLSLSPVHKAAIGIVDPNKGISLRFPRFIRIRDDKNAESATNSKQIADMYNNQDQIKNNTKQTIFNEEDFY